MYILVYLYICIILQLHLSKTLLKILIHDIYFFCKKQIIVFLLTNNKNLYIEQYVW